MKHGSTTSLQSQISSQLSEQQQVKAIQSKQDANIRRQGFGLRILGYARYLITLRLVCLKEEIAKIQPQMKKKVLFHQDNALCHVSMAIMAKLHEFHFKLLPPPSYSPDLAPNNYWLFADLKGMLQDKRFSSNEEVISETETYFEAKDKSFYEKALNY